MLDDDRAVLLPVATRGLGAESGTLPIPLSELYLKTSVIENAEAITVGDTTRETLPPGTRHLIDQAATDIRALALLPLVSRSLTDGVLSLTWSRPQQWSGDDVVFLATLCHQLAVGLAEARLRRELIDTNERLTLAQRASGAGTWDWDLTSGRLEWSPELYRLFGLDPSLPASFDLWNDLLHPDDREAANERLDRALRDHAPLDSEFRFIRPDGDLRWITALGHAVYADGEIPVRMTGICVDVTRRRVAEEEQRQTEARTVFALDNMHAGTWALDLVDHTASRSLQHDRIFGYDELLPEWTYEMFLDHVMPEDRQAVAGAFDTALATHGTWEFECRITRVDGETRWIWAAGRHETNAAGHPHPRRHRPGHHRAQDRRAGAR